MVASISCIYGIGSVEDYVGESLDLQVGQSIRREILLRKLTEMLYERNDYDLGRLRFRARGDIIDLVPAGEEQVYRVELPGPKVSKDIAADAKVRLSVPRARFNELATRGHVKDWREAFAHGDAKATGIEQVMKLIVNVVDRQEERSRTRKAKL